MTPILFLLPGTIGFGPHFVGFAHAIRSAAKVIPIKYPNLKSILGGNDTIAGMADAAVEQIQRSQPDGDIRLLGHSLGGAVAFEVAVRLLEAGRTVAFLGIADTVIVNDRCDYRATLVRLLRQVRTNRVHITRIACRALAKVTCRLGHEARLARIVDRKSSSTSVLIRFELQEVLRSRAFYRWLATSPKPVLPVHGTLFRCGRAYELSPSLGWDRCLASLDIIPVAGCHTDLILEPHLTSNRPLIEQAITQTCIREKETT